MRPRAPTLWKRSMARATILFFWVSPFFKNAGVWENCQIFALHQSPTRLTPFSPLLQTFLRMEEMFTFGGAPQMDLARAASEAAHFRPIFSNQVELVWISCSMLLCLMIVRAGDLIWLDMCTDIIWWIEDRELTGLERVTSDPQVQRETYENSALRQLMRSGKMSQRWDGWLSKEQ